MAIEDNKHAESLSTVESTPDKYQSNSVGSDIASLQEMIIGFKTVLDQTGTYIFTKDTAGRYTYVNQMTLDLFGASFEEIIGQDDSHFFDLTLVNELRVNDRLVIDFGKTIEREETNIIKSTGETRVYWTVKKPLRNNEGKIIGLCGISTDITERKAMENALRESASDLRLSQEGGGIGTWEADLVNNKQKWSKNCAALLGYSPQPQSSFDNFLDFVHPEDRQKILGATQRHIGSGAPYDVEYRAITADGNIRWLRSAGQVERDATGKPCQMRGIVQDVTERHDNHERIEQLLAEQKAIVENQLVGICITRDRKIVWANATFEAMFGYGKSELIGCSTRKLYLSEEHFLAIGAAYVNIGNNEVIRIQHEFVRKDGQLLWLDMSGAVLYKEINEFLWVFVDVTERKLAEAQKEKSLSLLYATLESTNDAILVVDLNNTWVLHNQHFLDLWQIPDELMAAKDDAAALSYVLDQLEDADAFLNKVFELYATPEISSFDILNFKNGKIIERYSIPQYVDSKVVGRVWSFRDVTKQKIAELALKKESEKNLALLRNASDGIHILDFDGNIIEVSDSFCTMLGYQRNEMIGMNVAQWDAHFIGRELLQVVRQQFDNPVHSLFETVHRHKDGTLIDVEVSGFPLELDGKPVLFNSSRDITNRKQTERRLLNSENKYRSLIDLASDAIFIADAASGIIIDCNQNASVLLGKAKHEIIGLNQTQLHPADKVQFYKNIFKDHIESGGDITEDVLVLHKDGYTIPVDIHASVVMLDGVAVVLGIFRNITQRKLQTDELNRIKKRYDLATSIGKVGIWDWNCVTGELVWNDETYRILGLDSAVTHPSYELYLSYVHKEDRTKIDNAVHNALSEKTRYIEDCRIILGNGVERICHATGEVECNEAGEPVRMLGTFQDITERKLSEQELKIAATAFESQEGMLVTDANKNILRVNGAFTHVTGYSAEEIIGKNPRVLQSGRHDDSFYEAMWESINTTGSWQGEIWNQRKNGDVFPEHLTITAVKDQDNIISNYVATFTDITLRKEAVDKIERLAFYDPLTGLPNRRLLQDRLKPALASSHRSGRHGALLFIDMDNFKTLNDTLGHDMGDLLLQQVAQRLESCVRKEDTVARLGGDEFVVMLEDLSEQTLYSATQAEIIGNKIIDMLNQSYQLETHEYQSTPSIGVTLFNGYEQSSEELLKQADIAMYQAKASGRNALRFFDPQMQACISARVALEKDLRLALEEDQFILYYQPQVHHSDQIIGAEVLIRWQHPVRGLVSPTDFIPIAEETHLISHIGEWVLRTACAQLKIWEGKEHTRNLQLAVNVSVRQFHQADFVEKLAQIISQNAINPNNLKLELTESLVLDNIDDTIFKMNALRKIGARFSMDDFGTGYSSLSSLKKLPLDQLKIDQSFVRDISIDQDDAIIVETIIAMANKLNMEVIAEGVETDVQRTFLEHNGCQYFQGYLFSKPVPIEQFELLLKKNSL